MPICSQAFTSGIARFNGGSNVPGHIGWLDLNSLQTSPDRTELSITFDGSNPVATDIFRWVADGTMFDSCQIDFIKDGNWYLRYSLSKAILSACNLGSGDSAAASATLNYASVSVDYRAPTATSATTDSGGISGNDFDC